MGSDVLAVDILILCILIYWYYWYYESKLIKKWLATQNLSPYMKFTVNNRYLTWSIPRLMDSLTALEDKRNHYHIKCTYRFHTHKNMKNYAVWIPGNTVACVCWVLYHEANTGSTSHAFSCLSFIKISEVGAIISPHFTDMEPEAQRLIYPRSLRW